MNGTDTCVIKKRTSLKTRQHITTTTIFIHLKDVFDLYEKKRNSSNVPCLACHVLGSFKIFIKSIHSKDFCRILLLCWASVFFHLLLKSDKLVTKLVLHFHWLLLLLLMLSSWAFFFIIREEEIPACFIIDCIFAIVSLILNSKFQFKHTTMMMRVHSWESCDDDRKRTQNIT